MSQRNKSTPRNCDWKRPRQGKSLPRARKERNKNIKFRGIQEKPERDEKKATPNSIVRSDITSTPPLLVKTLVRQMTNTGQAYEERFFREYENDEAVRSHMKMQTSDRQR